MNAGVKLISCLAVSLAAALGAPGGAAATNISHAFDPDGVTPNLGWEFFNGMATGPATWDGTAGNPPGSLSDSDPVADTDPRALFRHPTAFDGNHSANYGGTISFDFSSSATPTAGRTIWVAMKAPGLAPSMVYEVTPLAGTGFNSYVVPLTESGWQRCALFDTPPCPAATAAQFNGTLANNDLLAINVDVVDGTGETYGLDSVSLKEPAPPPIPPAIAPPIGTPLPPTPTTRKKCPKGKKLVVRKGKRKCKKRRKK